MHEQELKGWQLESGTSKTCTRASVGGWARRIRGKKIEQPRRAHGKVVEDVQGESFTQRKRDFEQARHTYGNVLTGWARRLREARKKKNRTSKRCILASVDGMDKANQRKGRRETEKGRDAQRKVLRAWTRQSEARTKRNRTSKRCA